MLNRRSMLKAAAAGIAAACGLAIPKRGPSIRFTGASWGRITGIGWSPLRPERSCDTTWHSTSVVVSTPTGEPVSVEVSVPRQNVYVYDPDQRLVAYRYGGQDVVLLDESARWAIT